MICTIACQTRYNSLQQFIGATVLTHLATLALALAAASVGKDHGLRHVGTSQTGGTDLAAVHPVVLGAGEGGSHIQIRGGSLGASLALAGEIPLLLGIASVLSDVVVDLGGVGREEGRRGGDERNGRESHFVLGCYDRK